MNDGYRYQNQIVVPKDAPSDYVAHQKDKLIKDVLWALKDGFMEDAGLCVSIKITEEPWPVDDYSIPGLVFTPYDAGTCYRATANVSRVKVIHETAMQLDAIQHDYRYVKLSDVVKHKVKEWVKGWKR